MSIRTCIALVPFFVVMGCIVTTPPAAPPGPSPTPTATPTATSGQSAAATPPRDPPKPRTPTRTRPRPTPPPGKAFIAAAPQGMSLNDLGKPYTADFVRLQGKEGQSLFPSASRPRATEQGRVDHAFVFADSQMKLGANASGWGVSLEAGMATSQRYGSYRAMQIKKVHEIDDTTDPRPTPAHAVYYPWRIYVGHSYEMLFSGSADTFHVGVQATMPFFSGGIEEFSSRYNLQGRFVGHGLKPKTAGAIFATTPEAIMANYETSGKPVPILVEWREIPGRRGRQGKIEWSRAKENCAGQKGCEPCAEWEFTELEWTIPTRKTNGAAWDFDESPPDVVVVLTPAGGDPRVSPKMETYKFKWKLTPPLRATANTMVAAAAKDADTVSGNDTIPGSTATVAEFLEGGHLRFGSGSASMRGRCVSP